ncbi:hypothetical protein, partial [Treponema sp. R80B11-R83G3]
MDVKNFAGGIFMLAAVFFIFYTLLGLETAITFTALYGILFTIVFIKNWFHDFWLAELAISLIFLPYLKKQIGRFLSNKITSIVKHFAPSISADGISTIELISIGVIILFLLLTFHSLIKLFPWFYKKHIFIKKAGKENIDNFCKYLIKYINKLDDDVNWNMKKFVDIEAHINNKQVNLLKALENIKYHNDKMFLVLGDPGSGKSVILRKFCLDMLHKVHWNNKIPLYINLKEWDIDWNKQNPTKDNLNEFI